MRPGSRDVELLGADRPAQPLIKTHGRSRVTPELVNRGGFPKVAVDAPEEPGPKPLARLILIDRHSPELPGRPVFPLAIMKRSARDQPIVEKRTIVPGGREVISLKDSGIPSHAGT